MYSLKAKTNFHVSPIKICYQVPLTVHIKFTSYFNTLPYQMLACYHSVCNYIVREACVGERAFLLVWRTKVSTLFQTRLYELRCSL